MKTFAFEFEWTIWGSVNVEAETKEEAFAKLEEQVEMKLNRHLETRRFEIQSVRDR